MNPNGQAPMDGWSVAVGCAVKSAVQPAVRLAVKSAVRSAVRMAWALAALLVLGSCSSSGPEIRDTSGEEWMARGGACVRVSEDGPVRRVINRSDPELCGREVKVRSRDYVRVIPPPGTRSR